MVRLVSCPMCGRCSVIVAAQAERGTCPSCGRPFELARAAQQVFPELLVEGRSQFAAAEPKGGALFGDYDPSQVEMAPVAREPTFGATATAAHDNADTVLEQPGSAASEAEKPSWVSSLETFLQPEEPTPIAEDEETAAPVQVMEQAPSGEGPGAESQEAAFQEEASSEPAGVAVGEGAGDFTFASRTDETKVSEEALARRRVGGKKTNPIAEFIKVVLGGAIGLGLGYLIILLLVKLGWIHLG